MTPTKLAILLLTLSAKCWMYVIQKSIPPFYCLSLSLLQNISVQVLLTTVKNCVKSVQVRSFFWSVFSCIRTEYSKTRTRKNSVSGHFSRTEST